MGDTEQIDEYMRLTGRWWELDTHPEAAHGVGLTADQLECPLQEAATVLRGHIAAHTQDPIDIARDIIDRKLFFAP